MIEIDGRFYMRKPEKGDSKLLYNYKNDSTTVGLLGGFHTGYSTEQIASWIEMKANSTSDVVWSICCRDDDMCIGHAGLYKIDFRVRKAEYGILIGCKERRGIGLGRMVTEVVKKYAFDQLNLNRLSLEVQENNKAAIHLYDSSGFTLEGKLRSAQFKEGRYIDVYCYSLLRQEWENKDG